MSQTDSQKLTTSAGQQSQSEAFEPKPKVQARVQKSKKTNQSLSKQVKQEPQEKPKKKGPRKKQQKEQKSKKEAPKKKPKSKKQGGKNISDNKQKVLDYMQKQNRPYNLLNIFDNLHGKIKKPELQTILNELAQEGQFSCKQFGKNKVYFINQDKFDLNMKQVEDLSSTYTHLKQQQKELRDQNKRLNDDYKKLTSKKTFQELQKQEDSLLTQIQKLQKKKQYLVGGDIQKVDEQEVLKIEKQSQYLQKQLKKRKKLTKQCLQIYSEMTQKKVDVLAEMMGIQLI